MPRNPRTAAQRAIADLMAQGAGEQEGTTFIDLHHTQRMIRIGDAAVEVRDGRVTVSDPAQVETLEEMYGMQREGK